MTCSGTTACTSGSSGLVTTVFAYDGFGNLAAEYSTPAPASSGTEYYTLDHLGSTRLVVDGTGAVKRRYNYLPFGEELFAGTNGRSTAYPAAPPNTPPRGGILFTSQERDSQTGLDLFGARYMSSAQGRFTSADPANASASSADHQGWNGYAYTAETIHCCFLIRMG